MADVSSAPSRIDIHHLTRVEGHGNIVVDLQNGTIHQCDLEIVEAPRFFEAMLRGRPYEQAPRLASRICGICAVTHTIASIKALESALGVEVSRQTTLLRRLNLCAEMLDSHLLHVYMLVAPDLLAVGSVFPLAATQPEMIKRAFRMKQAAGQVCAAIGGRHTHPVAMTVGGFTHLPNEHELLALLGQLRSLDADVDATVELLASLSLPAFERQTEYIALGQPDDYSLIDGLITSSDGGSWPVERYRQVTNEYLITHSTAKHAHHRRPSYMVGALARFNLSHDRLHPRARDAAARLGLTSVCHKPFMITAAQVVEIVHFYEEAIRLLGLLLEEGLRQEDLAQPTRRSGEGVGACEAPRGTLYHHYLVANGLVSGANCVIPTGQNLANIEADLRALAPQIWSRPQDEVALTLEMLVRAYDPCISCSTHMVEVRFV